MGALAHAEPAWHRPAEPRELRHEHARGRGRQGDGPDVAARGRRQLVRLGQRKNALRQPLACRSQRLEAADRIELYSLTDYTNADSGIDTTAFPNTPSDHFWSSTQYAITTASGAWSVAFGNVVAFVASESHVDYSLRVRCVRGGQTPAGNHYAVANGTVKDNWTGLTWQLSVDVNNYSWSQARSYRMNLALTGGRWQAAVLQTVADSGRPWRARRP